MAIVTGVGHGPGCAIAQATERFGAADILVNVRKINEKLLRGQCV